MSKKHVHAELIKQWADGAKIQGCYICVDGTLCWEDEENPSWHTDREYRIKPEPEPKPDVVKHFFVESHFWAGIRLSEASQLDTPVLTLTFDGETGKLKSAEVLK